MSFFSLVPLEDYYKKILKQWWLMHIMKMILPMLIELVHLRLYFINQDENVSGFWNSSNMDIFKKILKLWCITYLFCELLLVILGAWDMCSCLLSFLQNIHYPVASIFCSIEGIAHVYTCTYMMCLSFVIFTAKPKA